MRKANNQILRMCMVAVFGAMAYVVMLLIHIPVSFLTLDLKDALIILCGLFFGPISALLLSALVPLLEFATVSGTGLYGLVMNFLGTASISLPAALIYKYRKTFGGAIIGLLTGLFAMVGVMMLANLWITPYYMGVEQSMVIGLIPKLLLPFNAVKGLLNVSVVLLLYKHISHALQKAGALPPSSTEYRFGRRTAAVTLAALVLIAVSLVVIFAVLGGHFEFGIKKA